MRWQTTLSLCVDADDTEELPEVVSEEFTNKELLELEKKNTGEEAREKEISGEEKNAQENLQ